MIIMLNWLKEHIEYRYYLCTDYITSSIRRLSDYHVWLIIILMVMAECLFFVMFNIYDAVKAFKVLLGTHNKKETIESIAFGMGGIIAAIVALAVNRRATAQEKNNELVEKGNINERFKSATEHLGHNDPIVRIAAFHQFCYLAKDHEDHNFRMSIFEILCSCLRSMSRDRSHLKEDGKERPTAECQTLLNTLFHPRYNVGFRGFEPDLRRVYLTRANLVQANLTYANLARAYLAKSNLKHASLTDAYCPYADLSDAILVNARINRAHLPHAKLSNTKLRHADLSDAMLGYADLSGAEFYRANISNAVLDHANLSGTMLVRANLSGARLYRANLSGAHLLGANLSGANFSGAKLYEAQLQDVYTIEKANFCGAEMDNRPITKDDIPADKGEYYADWNPPPKKEES